jgi:hypothetical protein
MDRAALCNPVLDNLPQNISFIIARQDGEGPLTCTGKVPLKPRFVDRNETSRIPPFWRGIV